MSINPFKALDVRPEATQQEIVLAVVKALRKREYSAKEIADAQKELMHPHLRKAAEFIYTMNLHPGTMEVEAWDLSGYGADELEALSCFDKRPG